MTANPRAYRLALPALLLLAALVMPLAGCAHTPEPGASYSVTTIQTLDPALPRAEARRAAFNYAEVRARDQLHERTRQLRLSDGRALSELADADPFVRAVIRDTVRAARITDRTLNDKDVATITIEMDLRPIHKMVEEYPQHSLF